MLTAGLSEEGLRPMREAMAGHVEQGAMPGLIALAVGQPVGPGNEHGSMAGGAHAVEWVRIRYVPFTGSTSGSLPPSCWWLSPLGWPSPLGLGGHSEGWHLCSCRFDGHLTTCATNVVGHRDHQRSDCNPGARHLRWGWDIRRDRRDHRPRYRPDHFHPGCQGPATGGHGDRPRTHGMGERVIRAVPGDRCFGRIFRPLLPRGDRALPAHSPLRHPPRRPVP
jgi:hypothetical protein